MGSAAAEVLAQEYPVKMKFVGAQDMFGQSGTPDELVKHYGMDVEGIVKAAEEVLK
jgi:transketolase